MGYTTNAILSITEDFLPDSTFFDGWKIKDWDKLVRKNQNLQKFDSIINYADKANVVIPFSMSICKYQSLSSFCSFKTDVIMYINKNHGDLYKLSFDAILMLNVDAVRYFKDAYHLMKEKNYRAAILCYFATIDAIIASVDIKARVNQLGERIFNSPNFNTLLNVHMILAQKSLFKSYKNGKGAYKIDECYGLPRRNLYMHGMTKEVPTLEECYYLLSLISNLSRVSVYYTQHEDYPNDPVKIFKNLLKIT